MAVSESDRLHLFEVVCREWRDEQAAGTLMDLLPQERDSLATKADLRHTELGLRQEISEIRAELRGEMAEMKGELRQEIASLTERLLVHMNTQTRTLVLALAAMWTTLFGLILGLRLS